MGNLPCEPFKFSGIEFLVKLLNLGGSVLLAILADLFLVLMTG